MLNRLLAALLLSTFPAYCLAAKPLPVPIPVAPELQVELIQSQQEIAVSVPDTGQAAAMQFGLIGALVGSAVQNARVKKAEEAVVPLRNLLLEYPFQQRMEAAVRAKLPSEGLSPAPVLTVMPTGWDAHEAEQAAKLPPHALVLTPGYAIDSDFHQLTISLRAGLADRTIRPDGKVKTKLRLNHNYTYNYPLQGERGDEPVQDWIAFDRAVLIRMLDHGIAQVTDMLVQDFSADGRATWDSKPPRGASATVNGNLYKGQPVKQGDGFVWVRNGKGVLHAMQGFQPLTVGVQPILPPDAAHPVVVAAADPLPAADAGMDAGDPAATSLPSVQSEAADGDETPALDAAKEAVEANATLPEGG